MAKAITVQVQADELGAYDIPAPTRELHSSNADLDDPQRLKARFEEDGYLLFRDVLEREAVDAARSRMMAVLAAQGMVAPDATEPVWTGADWGDLNEDSTEFAGLGQALAQTPHNVAIFEKILGEPASLLPIIQYRFYPPSYPLGMPHQDGFYTPVKGFLGAWIPLADIDKSMGGLAVAVGQSRRGVLHNTSRPAPSPILKAAVPVDCWHTADFHAGDLLLIHRFTPHCGLPNRSNRLRLSLDIRLIPQSSAEKIFTGAVADVSDRSITLRSDDDGKLLTLSVDEKTFIRCGPGSRGQKISPAQLPASVSAGRRLMAVHDGQRATMLREASDQVA